MNRARDLLASHFGGLPKSFWVVFAGQLVNRVGSMAVPFLVLYLGTRGMSASEAGTVLAAVGLGGLVSQPLGGVLADRFGPRFALMTGLLAGAASILGLGLARGLPAVLVAAVLVGAASDVYRPSAAALVAAVVVPQARPRAYSLVYWAVNLGVGLAGLTAGLMARYGYGLLFVTQAVTGVLFALLIAVLVPSRGSAPRAAPTERFDVGRLLRDRLLLALTALNIVNGLINAQVTMGLPLAIKASGLGPVVYGAVFMVSGLLIGVTQPPLAGWLERFDRIVVLSVSWAVFGLGIAATGLARTAPEYLATVAVWTLGEIGAASFLGAIIADLAPEHAQGRYQAAFGWSYAAAALLGPPAGAYLYVSVGPWALWWSCALLGVLGAAGGLTLAAPVRRRLASPVPTPLMEKTP